MRVTKKPEPTPLQPRIYINSFPKSGTHLANLITTHIAHRQEPHHWIGTFSGNSWTNTWLPLQIVIDVINNQPACTWMQGHAGHNLEIEQALNDMGTAVIFVYRDLRDVAVSLTYHIESENEKRFWHPARDLFKSLGSHDARLSAVITGIEGYPGVVDRWELYAPWLSVPWILPVKYEAMRSDPRGTADRVLSYIIKSSAEHNGHPPVVMANNYWAPVDHAAEQMKTTKH